MEYIEALDYLYDSNHHLNVEYCGPVRDSANRRTGGRSLGRPRRAAPAGARTWRRGSSAALRFFHPLLDAEERRGGLPIVRAHGRISGERHLAFEAIPDYLVRLSPDVHADPLTAQPLGGYQRRGAACEGIEHHVTLIGTGADHALVQWERLLCGVAGALLCHCVDRRNVNPNILNWIALRFV